jgi:hypothetical protein
MKYHKAILPIRESDLVTRRAQAELGNEEFWETIYHDGQPGAG